MRSSIREFALTRLGKPADARALGEIRRSLLYKAYEPHALGTAWRTVEAIRTKLEQNAPSESLHDGLGAHPLLAENIAQRTVLEEALGALAKLIKHEPEKSHMQHPTTFRQEIDQAIRSAEQYTKNGQTIRRRDGDTSRSRACFAGAAVALLGGCRSITAPATFPACCTPSPTPRARQAATSFQSTTSPPAGLCRP